MTVIEGAEPLSVRAGRTGVLVLHGFTGNPQSMRGLAEAFVAAGHSVEMPLLSGHGTTIDDMLTTSWADWSADAEAAYQRLAADCDDVVVAGLSMGGSLTCWLAIQHPEIAAIICVNPAVNVSDDVRALVEAMIEAGDVVMDGIGSDVADPDSPESSYDETPLVPLLSMMEAGADIRARLGEIACPMLLFTSPQDHVVAPSDSDHLAAAVSGPVERVTCERSYHVATIDYDKQLIFDRSVEFVAELLATAD